MRAHTSALSSASRVLFLDVMVGLSSEDEGFSEAKGVGFSMVVVVAVVVGCVCAQVLACVVCVAL